MRQYNINIDKLPREVEVNGEIHQVNYGFRTCMLIEMCMFGDLSDEEKLERALGLFYKEIPTDIEAAIKKMLWFYACGPEEDLEEQREISESSKKVKRAYCFDQDAPMIYAAFMGQYHINLNATPSNKLHWWEFMAMFESLDEHWLISRVMNYRVCDTKNMGKAQKAHVEKMRKLYALKEPENTFDSKTKLARRNASMKEYVRKRTSNL